MLFKAIDRCRVCDGSDLKTVFDLGNLASCGYFPAANQADPPAMPLDVIQCSGCGLVQLRHNFEQSDLFRHNYGYRSGINESMKAHLLGIVRDICERRVTLRPGDVVLDIGSNDGTTLSFYKAPNLIRAGIDPTIERFKQYYEPGILTLAEFFTAPNFATLIPDKRARVITSVAMFYDLPDPNGFVADIGKVLAPDGLWVLEQSYLPTMMEHGSFDTICHEHLEYYCLRQIMLLAERNGLRVVDVELNDANGGSFRLFVGHRNGPFPVNAAALNTLLDREKREGYDGPRPFERLKQRVSELRKTVVDFLTEAKRAGRLVHGYGASTKGNTLLQYFWITPDLLPAIADRNPTKFGCRTPGTNIPIISEDESRAQRPDYLFVLPWHFRANFIERERDYIAGGGKLVFPLPNFEIVG